MNLTSMYNVLYDIQLMMSECLKQIARVQVRKVNVHDSLPVLVKAETLF